MFRRSLLTLSLVAALGATPLLAQTANTGSSAKSAYGARLTQPLEQTTNPRRVNNRIPNRINNRLSTRIERYTPPQNITAALRVDATERAQEAVQQPLPVPDE